MNKPYFGLLTTLFIIAMSGCDQTPDRLTPVFVTDKTPVDTDDPAIWINYRAPEQSLILGTDKGGDNGGIYVFDLQGRMIKEKCLTGLPRPNNIDIEYGFVLGQDTIDIAVFTQRNGDNIRVVKLPDMQFIDNGGIPVFSSEEIKSPMGIGLYKQPETGEIYAIVSRKHGPDGSYLWQYLLTDSLGVVGAREVRRFGAFKGGKEIEAIAVDDALGYVYYADEGSGIRKYHADPKKGNTALAFFGNKDFREDHEGISIYARPDGTGYILVSDQQANRFHVFTREGYSDQPHQHQRLAILPVSTQDSDGSEVVNFPLGPLFPAGIFVAMSTDQTFQLYDWQDLEEKIKAAVSLEIKK
jgi:3-phytase